MSSSRGSRRAPRAAWWRSTKAKALLSLGVVLGVGATGTLAYFTDNATLSTGSFTTGKLDLTLDQGVISPNATVDTQNGSITKASLAISALLPGESVAASVLVKNNDGVPFTYKANGKLDAASTFPTTAPVRLTFAVYPGTATNEGAAATGDRKGICTGTPSTPLFGPTALTGTALDVIGIARTLASNASENICFLVKLDPLADNDYQNKTATATFVFRAAQIGQTP